MDVVTVEVDVATARPPKPENIRTVYVTVVVEEGRNPEIDAISMAMATRPNVVMRRRHGCRGRA
jgi:hypothetical protein